MKKRFALGAAGAMVLLATAAWGQGARFGISGYQVEGNTLLPETEVQAILAGYTGPDRGLDDINAAAEALRRAYEKAGYPVVRVFPPEQAASGGRIQLKVVEGKVRSVAVKGNQAYDEANIRASLPSLQEGQAPNAPRVVAEIAMANENPAKQVAVNFQAGQQPGHIDATVNVVEDRPQKFVATLDNGGSKSTGEHRISLGYQNANLFNLDHMFTAQVGTSTDYPHKSLNLSAGYRVPFYGHGLSLDLIAAYSDTDSGATQILGTTTATTGKGTIFGARLNQPLTSFGEYRHKLIYGFDYKDFDNRCRQGTSGPVPCGTITTQPLSVSYVAQHNSPGLQAGGSAMFAMNIPGGAHGDAGAYNTAATSQRAHWSLWRFNAFVGVPLAADWQVRASANAQMTEHKLVAPEQFGAGGAGSVRGYTERAIAGDEGVSASLELYTPELAGLLSLPAGNGLRGLVFYDTGRIYHNSPQPGANQGQQSISSIGVGLRFNLQRNLSARLDFGSAQERLRSPVAGVGRERGDTYGQFAINYSF